MDDRDIHAYHGSAHRSAPDKWAAAKLSDLFWEYAWLIVVACLLALGFGWKVGAVGGGILFVLDKFLPDLAD